MVRADRNGIVDDAALVLLDLGHLTGLVGRTHVLVDDAHAALLSEGNGQASLGDCVHGSGQDRDVQRDVTGHPGLQADFPGQDLRVGRLEEDVVEGQGVMGNPHKPFYAGHPGT